MKDQKRKVGRPKLADNTLKKNSLYLVLVSVLILFILVTTGILTVIKPNNLLGADYTPSVTVGTIAKPTQNSMYINFS